jgi:hypothetical protein
MADARSPPPPRETLGHGQFSFTLNTCGHVIRALGRAAAEQWDAVLAAGSGGSPAG